MGLLCKLYILMYMYIDVIIREVFDFTVQGTILYCAVLCCTIPYCAGYGDQACLPATNLTADCSGASREQCEQRPGCGWDYTGLGLEYQVSRARGGARTR